MRCSLAFLFVVSCVFIVPDRGLAMGRGNAGFILGDASGQEGLLDDQGIHFDYIFDANTGLAVSLDRSTVERRFEDSDIIFLGIDDSGRWVYGITERETKWNTTWLSLGLRKYFGRGDFHPYLGVGIIQSSHEVDVDSDFGFSSYEGDGNGQFVSAGFLWSEEGPGFTFGLDFSKHAVSSELCVRGEGDNCLDPSKDSRIRQTMMVGYSF